LDRFGRFGEIDFDFVSVYELTSFSQFDFSIDSNQALGNQGLGMATVFAPSNSLEELGELDWSISDRDSLGHAGDFSPGERMKTGFSRIWGTVW
jgi:hypothetical protein